MNYGILLQITNCDIERRTNYSLANGVLELAKESSAQLPRVPKFLSTGNDDVTRETFIEISEDISG